MLPEISPQSLWLKYKLAFHQSFRNAHGHSLSSNIQCWQTSGELAGSYCVLTLLPRKKSVKKLTAKPTFFPTALLPWGARLPPSPHGLGIPLLAAHAAGRSSVGLRLSPSTFWWSQGSTERGQGWRGSSSLCALCSPGHNPPGALLFLSLLLIFFWTLLVCCLLSELLQNKRFLLRVAAKEGPLLEGGWQKETDCMEGFWPNSSTSTWVLEVIAETLLLILGLSLSLSHMPMILEVSLRALCVLWALRTAPQHQEPSV